jgi:F420H(2)-dependent quinone reductase
MTNVTTNEPPPPKIPPRVLIRAAWILHRGLLRISGGRIGLRPPGKSFGMLRLTTVGRRSGQPRVAIVGYLEDGPNLVTLAMNGWATAEPAWWLNLQAHPDTVVQMTDGPRAVRGRAAEGDERDRLWARWSDFSDQYDAWAAMRSGQTAVVVLEPRMEAAAAA